MNKINILSLSTLLTLGLGLGLGGCTDEDLARLPVAECPTTTSDSTLINGVANVINSYSGSPVYYNIAAARHDSAGNPISIDYMVHPAAGTAKGIILLIAGGKLNSHISGSGNGQPPTNIGSGAKTNFLVRSAHLFAAQGFTVITMDRPSDHETDTENLPEGYRYDGYRVSPRHAVDISRIINRVNTGTPRLPVFIAGTSRGAISTVVHHQLSEGITLSSPVTSGDGFPVSDESSNVMLRPSNVAVPAKVIWNIKDSCGKSKPVDSLTLVTLFNPWAGFANLGGGFDDPNMENTCDANTYHGFLGIESCAVVHETNWLSNLASALPAARPIVPPASATTTVYTPVAINVFQNVIKGDPNNDITIELPFATTSLGGTIWYDRGVVVYTPPKHLYGGGKDTFVYVARESNGTRGHNVITVKIN